jgi:23S rRNA pseudouridine2605 synthase
MRLAKYLAHAGIASRRAAEDLIRAGRVRVDGEVVSDLGRQVLESAQVCVDGAVVAGPEERVVWMVNKPAGVVSTARDTHGRSTVVSLVRDSGARLYPVGRLDADTTGLILLTNDGELARRLELPTTGWLRRYKVRVHGLVDLKALAALKQGVTVEGVAYGPIDAKFEKKQGSNAWLDIGLREGRNREIRRVLEHLGYSVTRLIRLSYGPFQLGNLERGAVEEVPGKVLADQLGSGEGPKPKRRPIAPGHADHRR